MWNVVIGLCTVLALFLWYIKRRNEYWKDRGVPFVPGNLLVGNMIDCIRGNKSLVDIVEDYYWKYTDHRYLGFMNYGIPALIVRDVGIIKDILIKDFVKFADNWVKIDARMDPLLSKNPFFAKGDKWKQIRAQLSSQFTPLKVKVMFPLMLEVKEDLLKYLKSEPNAVDEEGLNAKDLTLKFTTDMVASCAFGLKGYSFVDKNAEFFRLIKQVFASLGSDVLGQFVLAMFPIFYTVFIPRLLKKDVTEKFTKIILETVEEREKSNIKRGDFLDSIVEMKQKTTTFEYTSDYMTAHAMSFFLDGAETSSITLQYALYFLASKKDVQEKLRLECEELLQENDGKLTYDTLWDLKYLDIFIQETLRKYPAAPLMMKETTDTVKLPPAIDGYPEVILEKGTAVFIPTYAIQNDVRYYDKPDEFIPERFAKNSEEDRSKHPFMSFGDGPRICIGRRFAITQIKVAIFSIVTHFTVDVNQKTPEKFVRPPKDFASNVHGGIWLNFFPRHTARKA